MATHRITVTASTNAKNIDEVNEEISRLKLVIGILFSKLPPEQRDHAINEMQNFGLTEAAELYTAFNPKSE
ncbi:hypothetical protein [Citrobacter freundii]|uniref:hypothetical protein n=1 Tax=Citrobacter freundii TaxID=546 RepID=UPI003D6E4E12